MLGAWDKSQRKYIGKFQKGNHKRKYSVSRINDGFCYIQALKKCLVCGILFLSENIPRAALFSNPSVSYHIDGKMQRFMKNFFGFF